MKEPDYLEDLRQIRGMMERSTKFISLSGQSGIMAGIYALIGGWVLRFESGFNPASIDYTIPETTIPDVLAISGLILLMAVATAVTFSAHKARKQNIRIWNEASRQMLKQLSLPLISGGLLMLMFLYWGIPALLIPASLIFYGLALYAAGSFTVRDIRILGLLQVILGVISAIHLPLSWYCWMAGFGLLHILYGALVYLRYEKEGS